MASPHVEHLVNLQALPIPLTIPDALRPVIYLDGKRLARDLGFKFDLEDQLFFNTSTPVCILASPRIMHETLAQNKPPLTVIGGTRYPFRVSLSLSLSFSLSFSLSLSLSHAHTQRSVRIIDIYFLLHKHSDWSRPSNALNFIRSPMQPILSDSLCLLVVSPQPPRTNTSNASDVR